MTRLSARLVVATMARLMGLTMSAIGKASERRFGHGGSPEAAAVVALKWAVSRARGGLSRRSSCAAMMTSEPME